MTNLKQALAAALAARTHTLPAGTMATAMAPKVEPTPMMTPTAAAAASTMSIGRNWSLPDYLDDVNSMFVRAQVLGSYAYALDTQILICEDQVFAKLREDITEETGIDTWNDVIALINIDVFTAANATAGFNNVYDTFAKLCYQAEEAHEAAAEATNLLMQGIRPRKYKRVELEDRIAADRKTNMSETSLLKATDDIELGLVAAGFIKGTQDWEREFGLALRNEKETAAVRQQDLNERVLRPAVPAKLLIHSMMQRFAPPQQSDFTELPRQVREALITAAFNAFNQAKKFAKTDNSVDRIENATINAMLPRWQGTLHCALVALDASEQVSPDTVEPVNLTRDETRADRLAHAEAKSAESANTQSAVFVTID